MRRSLAAAFVVVVLPLSAGALDVPISGRN
jgi:hypothetical protein